MHKTRTMENLANYFGFTEEGLGQLLYTTNSFIAGGAPLSVFKNELFPGMDLDILDRKSTRLNSSH